MTDALLDYLIFQVKIANTMKKGLEDIDEWLKLYDNNNQPEISISFTDSTEFAGDDIILDSKLHPFLALEIVSQIRKYRDAAQKEYDEFEIGSCPL